MKRFLLSILAAVVCVAASAEFRWGPTAGVNVTSYKYSQDLFAIDPSVGGSAGVMGELMFPGIGFGIDFGLNYNLHGSKLHLGDKNVWASDGYGVEQSWLHTIEVPINLRFKYTNLNGIERMVAPFVYAGPLFSIIAGHSTLDALKYTGGSVMLQCGVGAELFEHLQISAGYYWGMTYETQTIKLEDLTSRSQGWRVNLTYLF